MNSPVKERSRTAVTLNTSFEEPRTTSTSSPAWRAVERASWMVMAPLVSSVCQVEKKVRIPRECLKGLVEHAGVAGLSAHSPNTCHMYESEL